MAPNGSPRKIRIPFQKLTATIHAAACKALKSWKYFNPDGMERKYSELKKLLSDLNIVNKSNKSIISLDFLFRQRLSKMILL